MIPQKTWADVAADFRDALMWFVDAKFISGLGFGLLAANVWPF